MIEKIENHFWFNPRMIQFPFESIRHHGPFMFIIFRKTTNIEEFLNDVHMIESQEVKVFLFLILLLYLYFQNNPYFKFTLTNFITNFMICEFSSSMCTTLVCTTSRTQIPTQVEYHWSLDRKIRSKYRVSRNQL